MTYGWAILAAIIAIGVLAYFGVFSPGKYITGSAVVNPPFYVVAWNVQADTGAGSSGVVMELRNNGGEDYTIQNVNIAGCGAEATPTAITAGQTISKTVDCGAGTLTAGQTFKGDVTIVYRKAGSAVDLTSTGTIAEKITA
ncbi:MAG TPA: hypothetical protein VJK51_00745 [Candidatus Nanoarchaeia archaeon]|nr:hypothetical protein [Candidatus Nanoarchaeia archaeon]